MITDKLTPSLDTQPKEKPLRTKRGHRKPEFLSNLGDGSTGSAFIQQGPVTLSPSSDAFSHTHPDPSQTIRTSTPQAQTQTTKRQLPNGHKYAAPGHVPPKSSPERAPKNAFDLYCKDMRSVLAERHTKEITDGSFDIEGALARGWSALDEEGRGEFLRKFEQAKKAAEVEKEAGAGGGGARQTLFDAGSRNADEDVEMAEEGDGVDTPSGEGGGFTAVNRG
jgi:non-histone protein 10